MRRPSRYGGWRAWHANYFISWDEEATLEIASMGAGRSGLRTEYEVQCNVVMRGEQREPLLSFGLADGILLHALVRDQAAKTLHERGVGLPTCLTMAVHLRFADFGGTSQFIIDMPSAKFDARLSSWVGPLALICMISPK